MVLQEQRPNGGRFLLLPDLLWVIRRAIFERVVSRFWFAKGCAAVHFLSVEPSREFAWFDDLVFGIPSRSDVADVIDLLLPRGFASGYQWF